MNKTDDIEKRMAEMMAEMAAEWAADDAERARKYKIASIFLAERMLDDIELVKDRLHLKEAVGSYTMHQRKTADDSLARRIADTKELIEFLKEADQEYFIGDAEKGKTNEEAVQLMKMFADYFRGDCNNLQLAKISNDIENFRMSNISGDKSVADAIVVSLEGSIRDIFKK
jgi:hypothetical protein